VSVAPRHAPALGARSGRVRSPGDYQERRWIGIYGCEDPDRHHPKPSQSLVSSDAEDGRAGGEPCAVKSGPSRRVVIENNKAWDAATGVCRAWLREFFQRKTHPPVAPPSSPTPC
jgi:hypothetical protein